MKLEKITIQNIKSFKERTEISFQDNFNILIGPNGGGKSNLIGIITTILDAKFRVAFKKSNTSDDPKEKTYQELERSHNSASLAPHWESQEVSYVIIGLRVTQQDLDNIKDINSAPIADKDRCTFNTENFLQKLKINEVFNYKFIIKGGTILNPVIVDDKGEELKPKMEDKAKEVENRETLGKAEDFRTYLSQYGLFLDRVGKHNFNFPILMFPNLRNIGFAPTDLHARHQGYELAMNATFTPENAYKIVSHGLASIFSKINHEEGYQKAKKLILENDFIKNIKQYLEPFSFDIEVSKIEENEENDRRHELRTSYLGKAEKFNLNDASSGEKQILLFVSVLTYLNVRNSLIVIDEPELNLHPRWQKMLMIFLDTIAQKNKCQFIISTHSPHFITAESLQYVTRLYRENGATAYHKLDAIPNSTNALHLINTQNNERVFFTDKVVLVEGISDRIIFSKLFDLALNALKARDIIEIVEVDSKNNLGKYKEFLDQAKIKNYRIADLDYVHEICENLQIRSLFVVDEKKACDNFLKPRSLDGKKLISEIKKCLANKDAISLENLLRYIECRHLRLKENLSAEERSALDDYIANNYSQLLYILIEGDLEDYYPSNIAIPEGERGKVAEAIAFVAKENEALFNEWLRSSAAHELLSIVVDIIGIDAAKKTAAIEVVAGKGSSDFMACN